MSEPLRIGLVAEGPTDRIVIEAALRAILGDRAFVLTAIQPEGSVAFGTLGAGWGGVYRWCRQATQRGGGRLSNDAVAYYGVNALLLHLDADVADCDYPQASITPVETDGDLPCREDCPPPAATIARLRSVLLSWCGEATLPERTVICMPSKSSDAWVLAALFPTDPQVAGTLECAPNPAGRFSQQPKAGRISKTTADYSLHRDKIRDAWTRLRLLSAAASFENDVRAVLAVEAVT